MVWKTTDGNWRATVVPGGEVKAAVAEMTELGYSKSTACEMLIKWGCDALDAGVESISDLPKGHGVIVEKTPDEQYTVVSGDDELRERLVSYIVEYKEHHPTPSKSEAIRSIMIVGYTHSQHSPLNNSE
jgi:hypothetical protein